MTEDRQDMTTSTRNPKSAAGQCRARGPGVRPAGPGDLAEPGEDPRGLQPAARLEAARGGPGDLPGRRWSRPSCAGICWSGWSSPGSRLRAALLLGFIGNVFNLVIPGAVGGDLIKAAYLVRMHVKKTQAIASMVIDRIIGLLGLFTLATIAGRPGLADGPERRPPADRRGLGGDRAGRPAPRRDLRPGVHPALPGPGPGTFPAAH